MRSIFTCGMFMFIGTAPLCVYAQQSATDQMISSEKSAASLSVSIFNQAGMQGLQGAVVSCYASLDVDINHTLSCAYLDLASNYIDYVRSSATGQNRTPYFEKITTGERVSAAALKAGIPATSISNYMTSAANIIHPLVKTKLASTDDLEAMTPGQTEKMNQLFQQLDSQSNASSRIPNFDTVAYCRRLGDIAGGSSELELSCRQQEASAKTLISSHPTTDRILNYCANLGQTAGGSYELMQSCIQQEESAADQLNQ